MTRVCSPSNALISPSSPPLPPVGGAMKDIVGSCGLRAGDGGIIRCEAPGESARIEMGLTGDGILLGAAPGASWAEAASGAWRCTGGFLKDAGGAGRVT